MEISERLRCLFSATVEAQDESFVVEIPKDEVELGTIEQDSTYRVALLPTAATNEAEATAAKPQREPDTQEAPVEEGETRTVEIEDIGDQGDGITRVERGFIVIVPDTDRGERVTIEITDVQENVAFADVVERVSYYE